MARLIFKLKSVPDDEADDIKNLLTDNNIEFYETPPGNWKISMHGLWLRDESQFEQAKQLIDEYQLERGDRVRQETQQKIDKGEFETFFQRLLSRPVEFIMILAIILLILYVSIMPFLEMSQG